MSNFLRDPTCIWHVNLKRFIFIVGLLITLAASETKAQTGNSSTTELPTSTPEEADVNTTDQTSPVPTSSPNLAQKFCNQTHNDTYYTKCKTCLPYLSNLCDLGGVQVTEEKSCDIQEGIFTEVKGCTAKCLRTFTTRGCCHGFWGEDCNPEPECPGGSRNPCNGHGTCFKKYGACVCEPEFEGIACELCTNVTKYGPNCSQDCTCVDGVCNNGVHGDGLCTEDNPCNSSVPRCQTNSQCIHMDPGRHRCECNDGYTGDGIVCAPINPCRDRDGGCDITTDCIYTGPNQHRCQCKGGYEQYIPGKGCKLKDMCTQGLCGPIAVCETREPLKYSCLCSKGYTWNGTECIGNIIERLRGLNTKDTMFKNNLQYMVNLTTRFYGDVLSRNGPFTIFVPTDQAFRNVMNNTERDSFLEDDNKIKQMLRQHIVAAQIMNTSLGSFYNLQGNLANLETSRSLKAANMSYYNLNYDNFLYRNKSRIVASNLEASNGIIHVINGVMGLKDIMLGDKQETVMDLIKNQYDYSTMYSMIRAAGLSEMFSQPNTTVLITNNGAWNSQLLQAKYYLMYDEEGLIKLEVILKNHVFPGVIDITDLISRQDMRSSANVNVKVQLSSQGQIQLDDDVHITKANIPVSTGLCHRVDKVLVPSYLIPLVNNTCEVMETIKVQGPCGVCGTTRTCEMPTDKPTTEPGYCHRTFPYSRYCHPWYFRFRRSVFPHPGCNFNTYPMRMQCSKVCLRQVKKTQCCKGFYGRSCIPCPGGFRNPCSGNGKCSDGNSGTGQCSCNENFSGTTCNQCAETNTFGASCSENCTCQFGQCDTGPRGTGRCKIGTCQLGYAGENCDEKLVPCEDNSFCPVNLICFLGTNGIESCSCAPGYEEGSCVKVDLCALVNSPCHQQATCSQTGRGSVNCTCNTGWHGDGLWCMPNHPCENHNDCHKSAICHDLEPGQYHCVCKTGYSGNGLACKLVDLCVENNGGCHPKAQCTFIKDGERNCTCPEFMAGDGVTCRGTIAAEIMIHPQLTQLRDLMKIVNDSSNILDMINNNSYTVFAPADSALKPFLRKQNRPGYWRQEENVLSFLNFHTIDLDYSTDDMMALDGVFKSYPTLYNGFSLRIVNNNVSLRIFANYSKYAVITEANIPAVNGYFHIISQVLEPFLPDGQEPSLSGALSSQSRYQLFYEALQKTNLLEAVSSLDEYTIFVLPNNVVAGINRKLTADFLKYYIVPQRIFTPSMTDGDVNTLLGSRHRLFIDEFPRKILVNGMKITQPDILTDRGVIHELNGVLHPVLHRCDVNKSELTLGPCGDCTAGNLTCPEGYTSIDSTRVIKYRCHFKKSSDADWETIGCQQICAKHTSKSECCDGYYGPHCDECPGGAETPCSGNGGCDDGEKGSGICKCNLGFSGAVCESCDSGDLVPPYCNISYNSCAYRNGNCSDHAQCNETSSGITCQCFLGYDGDGHTCTSRCDSTDNGRCHPQATCVPHKFQCECNPDFHGNGTWCQQNSNPCTSYNGGCDLERALCSYIEPKVTDMTEGKPVCDCKHGYVGDGKLCSSDLLDAISRIPELSSFNSWLHTAKKISTNITELFGDRRKTLTVFAPINKLIDIASFAVVDEIFKLPNYTSIQDDVNSNINKGNARTDYIKQWTLKSLNRQIISVTVNGQGKYLVNGVRIVRGNIETLNGILHLTEAPLASFEDVGALKSTNGMASHSKAVIPSVVTAVVVVLVALIAIIIYKKRRHLYIFRHSPTDIHSNIPFSKIKSNEADTMNISDNTQYENPLFSN